jgi:tetratricopeptide (TPR) repeat protein
LITLLARICPAFSAKTSDFHRKEILMKRMVLAVLLLYGSAFAIADYQKGRLISVTSSGQWVPVPKYGAVTYTVSHFYNVELNNVIYIGDYEQSSRWSYKPADFQTPKEVEVRIDGRHMYIKRPDGKDWKVAIVTRIDPTEDRQERLPPNPRKAASKHHESAQWLREIGERDRAIDEFKTALRLDPDYYGTHYDFGVLLYETGAESRALEEFRAAVRLDKKDSKAHCMVGAILLDEGKLNPAIEELSTAIRVDSRFAFAHFTYGRALEAKAEYSQALEEYTRAFHLDREFHEAKSAMERVQGKIAAKP